MDGEMAQGAVPLHGGDGQARFLHIVEHLGEDGEVKGGDAETQHPANSPHTDKDEECQSHAHAQPQKQGLFRRAGEGTGGGMGPAFGGIECIMKGKGLRIWQKETVLVGCFGGCLCV